MKKVFEISPEKSNYIRLGYDHSIVNPEGYRLAVTSAHIDILAGGERGILYGVATLMQLFNLQGIELPSVEIEDAPDFANRGYMLDVTRGRIPTMEYIKELIDHLAVYKINQLQLYVESSVRLDGLEEIWSQTDPLTPQELMEIDSYCFKRGIELVPCIATFGHLYDLLRSKSYQQFSEMEVPPDEPFTWFHRMRYHIINVSNPDGFALIASILDQYLPLFRSKKANICCDETFDLGKGRSSAMAEHMGYGELYFSYVNHLAEYLQNKGYEVMIWGDIAQNHPECLDGLNKEVTCLNWYYYYNIKEERIKIFPDHNLKQYVCPSTSGFSRLVNAYDMSFSNIKEMAQLGKKHQAEGFLNTDWGDSGHTNMPALAVPSMIYGAAMSWNTGDEREVDLIDRAISLLEYGEGAVALTGLLRELSRQDLIIFNNIVFFRDYKIYNLPYHVFGVCLYEDAKKEMMDMDEKRLVAAVKKSEELALKIAAYAKTSRTDITELCLSARGIALMQSLVLLLKCKEYKQEVTPLDEPCVLAAKLERWLIDYTTAWRANSREGELHRMKEFIYHICKILRSYEDPADTIKE